MNREPEDRTRLIEAWERVWGAIRAGDPTSLRGLVQRGFQASGFPLPDEAPVAAGVEREKEGTEKKAVSPALDLLCAFFREGTELTNLHRDVRGVQVLGDYGVVHAQWMAEQGLGENGSPRYVSGGSVLTFGHDAGEWRLAGWLGTAGPHAAQDAANRASDVAAIREQILRVFEAYRQKDKSMLRRTHTAQWRGFALSSGSVGKGIDAYMRAAEKAMVSVQFQEYRILELDAIFYGDVAIVPYVAAVAGQTSQGRVQESRLRVMDVYLREPSGWNQVASNVCLHPEEFRSV